MRLSRRLLAPLALVLASTLLVSSPAHPEVELAPGEPFGAQAAQTLLAAALSDAAGAETVRVSVHRPRLPLANPYAGEAVLAVERVEPTARGGFAATVSVRVGGADPLTLDLHGSFDRLVPVPVPAVPVAPGTPLDELAWTTLDLPEARVRGEWISHPDELRGTEALRPLVAGRPIARDAVGSPRVVRRGDPVTLVFRAGALAVETAGTARDDGSVGALVEVRNRRSGVVLSGRVRGPGLVEVESGR